MIRQWWKVVMCMVLLACAATQAQEASASSDERETATETGDERAKQAKIERLESRIRVAEATGDEAEAQRLRAELADVREHGIYTLPDVVVTGELLERHYVDTVTSTSTVTDADLDDRAGSPDLDGVLRTLPNVSVSDGLISIRGVNNFAGTANSAPLISTTVDGGWMSPDMNRWGELSMQLWDVERVEVLRGPQSTEQGPNSAAGAVVVKTADPTWYNTGRLRLSYADYETMQTSIAHGGPLVKDYLAYRIALDQRSTDGFIEDVNGRDNYGEQDFTQARAKLLLQPLGHEDLQLKFTIDQTRGESTNQYVDGQTADPEDRRPDPVFVGFPNPDIDSETMRAIFDMTWDLSEFWTLASQTAYTDFSASTRLAPINSIAEWSYDDRAFTQELSLQHSGDTIDSVMGLYYGRYTDKNEGITPIGIPFPPFSLPASYYYEQERETYAAFSSMDWRFANDWTLTGGLRVEHTDIFVHNKGSFAGLPPFIPAINEDHSETISDTVVLPRLGLRWNPVGDLTLGAQVSLGYRGGGASFDLTNFQGVSTFDPEYLLNYEFSIRDVIMNGTVDYGLNLFYTDWYDKQVATFQGAGLPARMENAGRAHSYGAEFQVRARPVQVRGLAIDAGVGVIESEYDEYVDGTGTDHEGNEFEYTPRATASLGVTYEHDSGLFAGGRLNYIGKGYNGPANNVEIFDYTTLDLQCGYQWRNVRLTLFATNVTDEFGIHKDERPGSNYVIVNDPSVYGVSLDVAW